MNNQIILMTLAMASLMLVGLPKAFANAPPGVPELPQQDTPIVSTSHDHSKQCRMDGFCDEQKKTTTQGHSTKHHDKTVLHTAVIQNTVVQPIKLTVAQEQCIRTMLVLLVNNTINNADFGPSFRIDTTMIAIKACLI